MKFYSTIPPLGGKPLDGGARANESLFHRVFSATPRVRVCARARAREASLCAHKLRPTICIVTHLPRGYVPRLFAPRLRFLRNNQWKKEAAILLSFLPPSSFSSFSSVSLSMSNYSLPRQGDLFAGLRYN